MHFTLQKVREQKIFNFLSIGNINLEEVLGVNKPPIQIIFYSLIEGPPKEEKCATLYG